MLRWLHCVEMKQIVMFMIVRMVMMLKFVMTLLVVVESLARALTQRNDQNSIVSKA